MIKLSLLQLISIYKWTSSYLTIITVVRQLNAHKFIEVCDQDPYGKKGGIFPGKMQMLWIALISRRLACNQGSCGQMAFHQRIRNQYLFQVLCSKMPLF